MVYPKWNISVSYKMKILVKFQFAYVRYHSGGSMKLNACILILAHMLYL
jgi:hypothetical protein